MKSVLNNKDKIFTHCIGEYDDKDFICNGDENAISELEQNSCIWKNRCKCFSEYLKENKKDIEYFLEFGVDKINGEKVDYLLPKNGKENFEKFCDKLIENKNHVEESAIMEEEKKIDLRIKRKYKKRKKKDKRHNGPSRKTKVAARRSISIKIKARRSVLLGLFMEFKNTLIKNLKNKTKFVIPGNVALPGQLYIINRIEPSRYLTIYCKTRKNKDIVLLNFRMKTANLAYDVRYTFTRKKMKELLSKHYFNKLNPEEVVCGGKFKTRTLNAGKEELSIIAETYAHWINDGIIKLPLMI